MLPWEGYVGRPQRPRPPASQAPSRACETGGAPGPSAWAPAGCGQRAHVPRADGSVLGVGGAMRTVFSGGVWASGFAPPAGPRTHDPPPPRSLARDLFAAFDRGLDRLALPGRHELPGPPQGARTDLAHRPRTETD